MRGYACKCSAAANYSFRFLRFLVGTFLINSMFLLFNYRVFKFKFGMVPFQTNIGFQRLFALFLAIILAIIMVLISI